MVQCGFRIRIRKCRESWRKVVVRSKLKLPWQCWLWYMFIAICAKCQHHMLIRRSNLREQLNIRTIRKLRQWGWEPIHLSKLQRLCIKSLRFLAPKVAKFCMWSIKSHFVILDILLWEFYFLRSSAHIKALKSFENSAKSVLLSEGIFISSPLSYFYDLQVSSSHPAPSSSHRPRPTPSHAQVWPLYCTQLYTHKCRDLFIIHWPLYNLTLFHHACNCFK